MCYGSRSAFAIAVRITDKSVATNVRKNLAAVRCIALYAYHCEQLCAPLSKLHHCVTQKTGSIFRHGSPLPERSESKRP
jgi:hypothetical protein